MAMSVAVNSSPDGSGAVISSPAQPLVVAVGTAGVGVGVGMKPP
jgi:hypothetical protein